MGNDSMKKAATELNNENYQKLINRISQRYIKGQAQAIRSVNESIIDTNWDIGKYIIEYEQEGRQRAKYGTALLENLSKDLTLRHGRGFSRSNLNYMRLFYLFFPICETLSHKLSWSHYCELVKIDNELERSFYYKQNTLENWSIRELKRQKESGLFLRLVSSKNKEKVLALARRGQIIENPEDIVKDVYVFEFLKIPEPYFVSKYQLYLPNKEELRKMLNNQLEDLNTRQIKDKKKSGKSIKK